MAFRTGERAGERAMWVLTGLVSIALGVVLAIRPDIGALTLATVFGLFSIVYGISTITIGAQVRRAGKTTDQLTHEPPAISPTPQPDQRRSPTRQWPAPPVNRGAGRRRDHRLTTASRSHEPLGIDR